MEDAQTEVYSGKTNKKSRCSLRASINTSSISEEYMRDNHIYIYIQDYTSTLKFIRIFQNLRKLEQHHQQTNSESTVKKVHGQS